MVPIVLLCGQAGSGKDTAAQHLASKHNGARIAQADPMKRFVRDVFGVSEEVLWGESDLRKQPVHVPLINPSGYAYYGPVADFLGSIVSNVDKGLILETLGDYFATIHAEANESGGMLPVRRILQTLGTEWGRGLDDDMWCRSAKAVAVKLLCGDFGYSPGSGLYKEFGVMWDFVFVTDGRFKSEILSTTMSNGLAVKISRGQGNGIAHKSESELLSIPDHFYSAVIDNNGTKADLFSYLDLFMEEFFDVTGNCGGCSSNCGACPKES